MLNYAGRMGFISNTTWLPTMTTGGFCIGDSRTTKPMDITLVGQISPEHSLLNPFMKAARWSLLPDFPDCVLKLSIVDPWTFGHSFHADFIQATHNLRLISESSSFPSGSKHDTVEPFLDMNELFEDCINLHYPFFRKNVTLSFESLNRFTDIRF
jgi:hypothetical protein